MLLFYTFNKNLLGQQNPDTYGVIIDYNKCLSRIANPRLQVLKGYGTIPALLWFGTDSFYHEGIDGVQNDFEKIHKKAGMEQYYNWDTLAPNGS